VKNVVLEGGHFLNVKAHHIKSKWQLMNLLVAISLLSRGDWNSFVGGKLETLNALLSRILRFSLGSSVPRWDYPRDGRGIGESRRRKERGKCKAKYADDKLGL